MHDGQRQQRREPAVVKESDAANQQDRRADRPHGGSREQLHALPGPRREAADAVCGVLWMVHRRFSHGRLRSKWRADCGHHPTIFVAAMTTAATATATPATAESRSREASRACGPAARLVAARAAEPPRARRRARMTNAKYASATSCQHAQQHHERRAAHEARPGSLDSSGNQQVRRRHVPVPLGGVDDADGGTDVQADDRTDRNHANLAASERLDLLAGVGPRRSRRR